MIIKSFVGGHSLRIYADCVYDESIRKYRGGSLVAEIPYSSRMLSAKIKQENAELISYDGILIPVKHISFLRWSTRYRAQVNVITALFRQCML